MFEEYRASFEANRGIHDTNRRDVEVNREGGGGMAANVGATFLRIVLGAELTRLRKQAGLTGSAAAATAGCSASTISDVEQGKTGFRRIEHLAKLLEAFGVDEAGCELIMGWHRQAKGDDWWSPSVSELPSGMNLYLALESGASEAKWWVPSVVNGLCQTRDYAHALILTAKTANDTTDKFVESAVEIRMTRQKRITEEGMRLHCIMDEAALTNTVGSSTIMRAQLEHIAELNERPNIDIQIIPKAAPTYRAVSGDFAIFSYDPKQSLAPAVASGTVDGTTRISSKEQQAKEFTRRFETLARGAMPAYETPKLLERLAREV
ncbi:helix-turn-helix transcriptional regulator [Streptomyces sp. NPDC089795]|uniref:helix-turn-helix domain-containing protein n=1 Tax=Streptomyces sp. NPDC089795 TaxID=3155297 RepID=UPI003425D401